MMPLRSAIAGAVVLQFAAVSSASAVDCARDFLRRSMPCQVDTIAAVEITFDGAHLRSQQRQYEQLVRLRLRNDLSTLRYENSTVLDTLDLYQWNTEEENLLRRGSVSCNVWTIGSTDYPIVYHLRCGIAGLGRYQSRVNETIERDRLGFSNRRDLAADVGEGLRELIASVSIAFLDARGTTNSPAPAPPATVAPAAPAGPSAPHRATNPPRRM